MISIIVKDEVPNISDMAGLLREIAGQLDAGFTSGYYPHWKINGDEGE